MTTDKEQYVPLYPVGKLLHKKVRAFWRCPRCKENNYAYITPKGKKRGVAIKLQIHINTLMDEKIADYIERYEDINIYQCNVCGFRWEEKEVIKY